MDEFGDLAEARYDIEAARREAAAASARLAAACVRFADRRTSANQQRLGSDDRLAGEVKLGEFVADEVSLVLREQPYHVRCMIARSRRLATGLPTVWTAYLAGEVDADQIRVIDCIARRVAENHTLAAIDDRVVEAAQTRCPKRLATWLLRLVVQLEPAAFAQRHRKALAERRVTVVQGADGIGYVTGEVSAADAAAIDAMLAATARSLGAEDPRTDQQRRADCFADLLLGRLGYDQASRQPTLTRTTTVPWPTIQPTMNQPARNGLSANLPRTRHARPRAGSRSKTSTTKPENCSAPTGSGSTATASRSANRWTGQATGPARFDCRLGAVGAADCESGLWCR